MVEFRVTEIISEKRDKVWKLYGMSETELEKEKEVGDDKWGEGWVAHLLSDGIRQRYRYCEDAGEFVGEIVFNLSRGEKPYFVGYVGHIR